MPNGEKSSVEITSLLLERARFLIILSLTVAVLLTAASFLLPKIYRAECKIVPSNRFKSNSGFNIPGALQGASSLMGLDLSGQGSDISKLFPQIVRNQQFSKSVLDHEFTNSNSHTASLAQHLNEDFDGSELAYLKLARRFNRKILKISTDERNGITTLAVESEDPLLAKVVVNFCVEKLDNAHRGIISKQSRQMVDFLDERLESSAKKLLDAEMALEAFNRENRVINGAIQLELQEGRLLRNINLKNELFLSLSGQLEMARIELFREMPTIVVLSNAVKPLKPFKPNRPLVVFLSLVFAFFLSFMVVIFQVGKQRYKHHLRNTHE